MQIKLTNISKLEEVRLALDWAINENSRFKSRVEIKYKGNTPYINLGQIRLKQSKVYCGSHPFACDVEQGRKATLLEGADWVEFNDRVNDVLDSLFVSADVRSVVCIIRKETRRRFRYWGHLEDGTQGEAYEWDLDEHDTYYEDYCGMVAPNSEYPKGTPGLYERDPKEIIRERKVNA